MTYQFSAFLHTPETQEQAAPAPIRFPVEQARRPQHNQSDHASVNVNEEAVDGFYAGGLLSGDDLLEALEDVSRRIDDLARDLDLIDQSSDDGPRAA